MQRYDSSLAINLFSHAEKPVRALLWDPNDPGHLQPFGVYALCEHSIRLSTQKLTHYELHASLAPVANGAQEAWDTIVYVGITEQANILAALSFAAKFLTSDGNVFIQFNSDNPAPRLPRWREYWSSIATRVGLDVVGQTDDSLHLKRAEIQPRWTLKLADETDTEAIRGLFKFVFQSDMSDALWAWKYGCGRGNAVLAYRDGQLIAHYGGLYRNILLANKPALALQACDVMVHPSERGVFTRRGAFFTITATWAEMYGPLDFGFPNQRSMRLGEKLGIYLSANHLIELRWATKLAAQRPWGLRAKAVSAKSFSLAKPIHQLWNAMQASLPHATLGVRDWPWIEHRYLAHPVNAYTVYALKSRWTGRVLGIIVMRVHADDCELLDVIAPMDKIPLLIDEARRVCAHLGKNSLYAWVSDAHVRYFEHAQPAVTDLDIHIPTDAWTNTAQAKSVVGTWWMTAGDTDFR